ncbi:MAG: glycogen synthase, partial [Oscillospiraceae bacterium]
FFSRAILEMVKNIDFAPDIIHSNDWQTALVNVYINLYYRTEPKLSRVKTLFTIHNIQYQGKYGMEIMEDTLGVGANDAHILEFGGCINFMKGAIECADKVNTVSPSYANEILDPWFSHGLDPFLSQRVFKLSGIVNGIDYKRYDPATDKNIAKNYTAETFTAGKKACKTALRKEFNLNVTDEPVIGMVTRLVSHKGLDLVRHVAEYILLSGMQLVLLGNGDYEYENFFNSLAARYPGQFGLYLGFKPDMAQRIYAGSDMFLMPSKSEPCGLAQMVSLRYGTVPIVRETGGLRDTIQDSGDNMGNGFTFKSYNAHDMLDACLRAKEGYEHKDGWKVLVKRDMTQDYSWSTSAKKYIELYKDMETMW